jgi:hypothetical protein
MSMMNALLPPASPEQATPVRGIEARRLEPAPAKRLGWRAARRYNEVAGNA